MIIKCKADKYWRWAAWALLLALLASPRLAAWAQETEEQPPLTGAEVEKFIVMTSEAFKARPDQERMRQIVLDAGWSQNRLRYLSSRIENSLRVIKGESALEAIEADLRPTEQEVALVRLYEARLDQLRNEVLPRLD